jgi:hypothetical protein
MTFSNVCRRLPLKLRLQTILSAGSLAHLQQEVWCSCLAALYTSLSLTLDDSAVKHMSPRYVQ